MTSWPTHKKKARMARQWARSLRRMRRAAKRRGNHGNRLVVTPGGDRRG